MAAESCPDLERYRPVVVDLALGDTSVHEAWLVDTVRRHLERCARCRDEAATYERLVASLQPPPVSEGELGRILAAARNAASVRIEALEARRRRARWTWSAALGAASLLLAFALWSRLSDRIPPPPSAGGAAASPGASPVPEEGPSLETPAHASAAPTTPAERLQVSPEHGRRLTEARRLREEGDRHARGQDVARAEALLRRALDVLQGVLDECPNGEAATAAYYERYRCCEVLGDYLAQESAFGRYLGAVRERAGDEAAARALLEDARRLLEERRPDTAGQRLERALALCPSGPAALAAHVLLGAAAQCEGLADLAYAQYQTALGLGPPPALAARLRQSLVWINERRGRLDEAIADAEALCALSRQALPPARAVAHQLRLARLYERTGALGKAVRVLSALITAHRPELTRGARAELERLMAATVTEEIVE